MVYGDERDRERKYSRVDATYRVNRVNIKSRYEYTTGWGYELETWITTVEYQWGIPQPVVTVSFQNTTKTKLEDRTTGYARSFSRREADKDPFLFPPPLFKTPD